MTHRTFVKNLVAKGYTQKEHPCSYQHYFISENTGIVLDNVRGGAYRLFLGLNYIPASFPSRAEIARREIDAESPWFHYHGLEEKGHALERCWQWLDEKGFPFIANPFSRELHEWIRSEKIKIRDNGVIISTPREGKLP